jgi:hypothetical protein
VGRLTCAPPCAPQPLVERAAFEAAWGQCLVDGLPSVLVALPYSKDMACPLRLAMFSRLKAMECANPGFNLELALYDEPYNNNMDACALSSLAIGGIFCQRVHRAHAWLRLTAHRRRRRKTKQSGRGVLATIRNVLLARYLRPHHDWVLWLDADVVQCARRRLSPPHTRTVQHFGAHGVWS